MQKVGRVAAGAFLSGCLNVGRDAMHEVSAIFVKAVELCPDAQMVRWHLIKKKLSLAKGLMYSDRLEMWIEAQEHHLQRHGSLAGGALLHPLTSASFSAIRKIAEANTLGVFCMIWLQCLATLAHESCNANRSRKPEERKAADNAFNVAGTLYGSLLVGMLAD